MRERFKRRVFGGTQDEATDALWGFALRKRLRVNAFVSVCLEAKRTRTAQGQRLFLKPMLKIFHRSIALQSVAMTLLKPTSVRVGISLRKIGFPLSKLSGTSFFNLICTNSKVFDDTSIPIQ